MGVKRGKKKASAKDGEGAGRGPCGLRNSELGPLPQGVLFRFYNTEVGGIPPCLSWINSPQSFV